MIGIMRRRPALAAMAGLFVVLAAGARAQFLDALTCGMDPLFDYCVANRLGDFAEQGMPNGPARDLAIVASVAGIYFSHRSEAERTFVPDPAYYRAQTTTDTGDALITMIDQVLRQEDYAAAAERLDAMEPGVGRLTALRYLAEGHLRFGDSAIGQELIDRFAEEIAAIPSPQGRLSYLPDLAWLYGLADDPDSALAVAEQIVAVAETHPITQLRPIFAISAGFGEGIALGADAGVARIEAGLESLAAMDGLPPTFLAETYAIAAENYGRLGFETEARSLANSALNLFDEADPERRWHILRDVMEAGIPF